MYQHKLYERLAMLCMYINFVSLAACILRYGCQIRPCNCGAAPQRLCKPVGFLLCNLAPTIARQAATLVLIAEPERGQSRARVDLQSGMIMGFFAWVNMGKSCQGETIYYYLDSSNFQLSDSAEPGRSHGGHF